MARYRARNGARRRLVQQNEIRLLASLLPQVRPGLLLDVAAGRGSWPHNVFSIYWPRASAHTFAAIDVEGASGAVSIEDALHPSAASAA